MVNGSWFSFSFSFTHCAKLYIRYEKKLFGDFNHFEPAAECVV